MLRGDAGCLHGKAVMGNSRRGLKVQSGLGGTVSLRGTRGVAKSISPGVRLDRREFQGEEGKRKESEERERDIKRQNGDSPHKGGESILRHFCQKQACASMDLLLLLWFGLRRNSHNGR